MIQKILNFLHLHTHLEYMGAINVIYEFKKQKEELEKENIYLKNENKRLRDKLKGCVKLRGRNVISKKA